MKFTREMERNQTDYRQVNPTAAKSTMLIRLPTEVQTSSIIFGPKVGTSLTALARKTIALKTN